jgi:DNA repair ATPase RecN
VKKNVTFASARVLSHDERVDELARMLSGGEAKTAAIEHARELLAR